MEIKIKGNAHEIYAASIAARKHMFLNDEWYEKLKAIAGMTLKVETDYLFKDQFNTAPIEGVSETGMRVMAESVEWVIDDEREYALKCNYCGQVVYTNMVTSERCPHCGQGDYLVPLSKSAEISFDYKIRARSERAAGGSCEVNEMLPTISIKTSAGEEYFFQGEEAEDMLKEYETLDLSCSIEQWLLAVSQSW